MSRRHVRLVGIELSKLRSRRITWTLLLLLAGLSIAMPGLFYLAATLGEPNSKARSQMASDFLDRVSFPGALAGSLGSVLSFGLPFVIVLSAAAFGGEFAWGTLRLLLIRGEGRREFVLSKLTALFMTWVVFVVTGTGIGLLTTVIIAAAGSLPGPAHVGWSDISSYAGQLGATFVGGWVYVSLTALATLRFRSTAFGIGFGLFLFFGERFAAEAALATSFRPLELVAKAGLNYNLRSLTGGAGDAANPLPLALFAVAAFFLASIVGSLRQLDRADITIAGVG
jgi:ABC-type transport system involved in multi-copper enzyme maturation permease subunit